MSNKRLHHSLSQFYLKGFTKGRSKKSKLTVVDAEKRKTFQTTPRNVGGVRDFNRIDADDVDPNVLENALSKFEGQVASALKRIEENKRFDGADKALVLQLIALLVVRSPEQREHLCQFQAQIAERFADLVLESKESWESHIERMRRDCYRASPNITYEQARDFHDQKQYSIEVKREGHIQREFAEVETILPCLFGRKWIVAVRPAGSGPFITTDNPAVLLWKNLEDIPPMHRNSPGYGMKDTIICFPLSQDMTLVGHFEAGEGLIEPSEEYVAHQNWLMIHKSYGRIYAPTLDFQLTGRGENFLTGRDLLRDFWA